MTNPSRERLPATAKVELLPQTIFEALALMAVDVLPMLRGCTVIQTLAKNSLLLALSGILDAVISVIYLLMHDTNGPMTFHSWNSMVTFLGKLAIAAGVFTIAAGTWRSATGKSWLLMLNGFALGALGLIQYGFVRFRVSFLTVALLIVVMAVSTGILELVIARTLRQQRFVGASLLVLAGVASIGFALAFFAVGFGWITIEPGSHADLLWLGSYFGFNAICMLGLALLLRSQSLSPFGPRGALPPLLGNPRHAH
jgi:uncharacterized membrane protein HdeD (DUF308 family)